MLGFLNRLFMTRLEVTCITRGDDFMPISALGGPEFYAIEEHVVAAIQFGKHSFWVSVDGKEVPIVFGLDRKNQRFTVTTLKEDFPSRILLSLPECDEEARRRSPLKLKSPSLS